VFSCFECGLDFLYKNFHSLRKLREVDPKTKIQIYKSVHIPTLIHGAESWQLATKHENRIIATEMKFIRTVGKTRRDKWRSNGI
jgi:hypothetical protein